MSLYIEKGLISMKKDFTCMVLINSIGSITEPIELMGPLNSE